MSSLKERVNAVINSRSRNNPGSSTSGNFTYTFDKNINRITDVIIRAVQIPFTFYVINSSNNVLKFNNNTVTATITAGNYNNATILIELKSKIDAAFADTNTTVTFNNITSKLTITRTAAFILDAAVDVPTSTLSTILGYSVSSASGTSATANNVLNISGPNYLLIESAFLTKAIQHKTVYATSSYANALLSIPVNVGPNDIITMSDQIFLPVRLNYKFNIRTTDSIDIKIKDDTGTTLDLNGADIAIQLVFITE
jgi:hypothetical protein